MQRTCFVGSPDSQLAFWLMIVSIAMAVLPVWRSPMISWRWPRPIGIIASMALMPVCIGSCTLWRCMTPGAWSSSARTAVGRDSAEAVERVAERVDDAAEVAVADGRRRGPRRCGVTSMPSSMPLELAEDDDADLVLLEVQREAGGAVGEADELVGHDAGQALDVRDAVGGVDHGADLGRGGLAGVVRGDEVGERVADVVGADAEIGHRIPS